METSQPVNSTLALDSPSQKSFPTVDRLYLIATRITVKIISKNFVGSGILLYKEGSTHIILTNSHVLRVENPPYFIRTFDGKIHSVRTIEDPLGTKDLALLSFPFHWYFPHNLRGNIRISHQIHRLPHHFCNYSF